MSWDDSIVEGLVSDNVASVNESYEMFRSGRVRRKGQAMSDAARKALEEAGVVVEPAITLGIGMPAIDTVPKEELAISMSNAILRGEDRVWGYGGGGPIREALAEHFTRVRGVEVTAQHFLADGGSSGAIGSIARAFLSPGDAVISERPGYVGSMDAFTSQAGCRYLGVDLDDDGLNMGQLAEVVAELKAQGNTAKMLYIQSLYHNPRGTGYTVERMREMLTFCAEHSILILNDEAYYGLHLTEEEPTYLSVLAAEMGLAAGVITACTFSKTIAPGLRAGYTFAEPVVINQISSVKMGSTSSLLLLGLADFIERGEWDKQIAKVQQVYTAKLDALVTSLNAHCDKWLTFDRPKGGLYIWCTLREGVPFSAGAVEEQAIVRGLTAPDGTGYFLPPYVDGARGGEDDDHKNHLRLCFAGPTVELLTEAGRCEQNCPPFLFLPKDQFPCVSPEPVLGNYEQLLMFEYEYSCL
jgi:DNA-binding transcriptional MocR family regulator